MMSHRQMQMMVWGLVGLSALAAPVWAQTMPPIQNGQVELNGTLPRTSTGAVDVEALKQTIQAQFARPGVQEVQFRNVSLTQAEQRVLFLNSDPNKNLLRQVSIVVPSPNGAERNVTFRNNDFRVRVGREEGQLRARIEGIDHSPLTETERQSLRAQFDRFRLEGANDRGGNRADNRSGRGGNDNSGPGSANSGPGSANNSGSERTGGMSGRGGHDDVRTVNDDRREDRRADRRQDRVANIDRPDRPQRPERPERSQRPERPERPERSGRN